MKSRTVQRETLETYLNDELRINHFKDYCPNGLQVQGKSAIKIVVTGVTACLELIEQAALLQADAIVVHHGWFWKNDDVRIVRQLHARLKKMLAHDMSLFAYHLPLDQHPTLGNNVQLAAQLGFDVKGQSPENTMVWFGKPQVVGRKMTLEGLTQNIAQQLGRTPTVIGDPHTTIKKVAWCTGAAQAYIQDAAELGADVYISGEISEQTAHFARELGIAYISAGHHATESFGVQAVGAHLAKVFGIRHIHVDVPNPA